MKRFSCEIVLKIGASESSEAFLYGRNLRMINHAVNDDERCMKNTIFDIIR